MRGWKHRGRLGLQVPAVGSLAPGGWVRVRPRLRRLSLAALVTALVGGVVWFGVSLVQPRGAGQNLSWLAAPTTNRPGGWLPTGSVLAQRLQRGAPLVLGHRGGTERGYQNSMAAFNDAIRLRVNYIETDVRHTRDGQAVLIHDPRLPPVCTPYAGAAVRSLTAAELGQVRCAGQSIPRLDDLVARLRQPDATRVGLMAEVKDTDPLGIRNALAPLGWQRTIIESFDWSALATIEQDSPQVPTCPLGVTLANLSAALAVTHDCIGPEERAVTAQLITRAHHAGVGVLAWTVDDPSAMDRLARQGIDGLITDRPRVALALQHLRRP